MISWMYDSVKDDQLRLTDKKKEYDSYRKR